MSPLTDIKWRCVRSEMTEDNYRDIISMEYPLKNHDNVRHPRMPIADRAKIFSPFAALKGYEDEIEKKDEIYRNRK